MRLMRKSISSLCIFTCLFLFLSPVHAKKSSDDFFKHVEEAASWIKETLHTTPELLVVLTAGIEGIEDSLKDKVIISSADVPHFPVAHAQGHEGKLIFGLFEGKGVVLMKGRYHYYEGLSPQQVVFPYFVLQKLGVKTVITTNAVGGINYDLNPGDIVMLKDHINGLGDNPLRRIAMEFPENQFTDMTQPYDLGLRNMTKDIAKYLNISLKEGVYIATMGPSYETKAEIAMFRLFGADVVGMSTVFEVISCNFLKLKVLSFSCVANPAADRHTGNMNHEEVLHAMHEMGPRLKTLIENCMKKILKP